MEQAKLNKIRYSWLERISNIQFMGRMGIISKTIENVLADSDYLKSARQKLFESNGKLQDTIKTEPGHELTKTIAELHSMRKGTITSIMYFSKIYRKGNFGDEKSQSAEIVYRWARLVGKNHYHAGLDYLTRAIEELRIHYNDIQRVRDAIQNIGVQEFVDNLFVINDKLQGAHAQRSLELAQLKVNKSISELRKRTFKDLRNFLNLLNAEYVVNDESDIIDKLYRSLYFEIEIMGRRIYLRRKTMRLKRKMRLLNEAVGGDSDK